MSSLTSFCKCWHAKHHQSMLLSIVARCWSVGVHSWAYFASWKHHPMDTAFIEDLTAFKSISLNVSSVQSVGINLSLFLESSMMCLHRHGAVAAILPYSS